MLGYLLGSPHQELLKGQQAVPLLPLRHLQEGVRREQACHPLGFPQEGTEGHPHWKDPSEHIDRQGRCRASGHRDCREQDTRPG